MEVLDVDTISNDSLAKTAPGKLLIKNLVTIAGVNEVTLDVIDAKKKVAGTITIKTEYIADGDGKAATAPEAAAKAAPKVDPKVVAPAKKEEKKVTAPTPAAPAKKEEKKVPTPAAAPKKEEAKKAPAAAPKKEEAKKAADPKKSEAAAKKAEPAKPAPPPADRTKPNANCKINLKIMSATFLKDDKDAGTFGMGASKQDPFIEFTFGGKTLKTKVIEDGGLKGEWNETFPLLNVEKFIKDKLILIAKDSDLTGADYIGETKLTLIADLIKNEDVKKHTLDLLDTKKKSVKAGAIIFET